MDVQAIDTTGAAGTAAAAKAGQLPAFPGEGAAKQQAPHEDSTLKGAISQLVGGGAHVAVQYRVEGNEIVTVFTNADTGEVITQFPREAMVLIAQFFNKLAGAMVDRTA